jgi:hypothetical protein
MRGSHEAVSGLAQYDRVGSRWWRARRKPRLNSGDGVHASAPIPRTRADGGCGPRGRALLGRDDGLRSYVCYRLATNYSLEERVWRESTARGDWRPEVGSECADYFARLAGKYRRAMWRPWLPIAPDPLAPGVEAYQEQQRREAARSHANP